MHVDATGAGLPPHGPAGAFAVRLGQFLHGGIRWLREALLFAPCFLTPLCSAGFVNQTQYASDFLGEGVRKLLPDFNFHDSPRKQLVRHEEKC